jgi:ribosomal protein S18 acetylase RimI-like enzyme
LTVPLHEAAAIVCFVVAPAERRRGVARALLAAALDDLARRGIRTVDAYPRRHDAPGAADSDHYRGPLPMFVAAGFEEIAARDQVLVMRKSLEAPGT